MQKANNFFAVFLLSILPVFCSAQLYWQNVDSLYQPLPRSIHVFTTTSKIDTGSFKAFYLIADLKDKELDFTADTTFQRRLTPVAFFAKNDKPLVVVNCTFFSFETNKNLNVVVKDGRLVSKNYRLIKTKNENTTFLRMPHLSAIGIHKKKYADVAWVKTDTLSNEVYVSQFPPSSKKYFKTNRSTGKTIVEDPYKFERWRMKTVVGGGPVLLQDGEIKITNEEEMMFAGKAIHDKHPRTAMGYTKDNKLIILVVEGRNPGVADGATLIQEAQLLKDLGCWEALNLDGGGSSCLLINGKETIKVSDKTGQRAVPAVFLIHKK